MVDINLRLSPVTFWPFSFPLTVISGSLQAAGVIIAHGARKPRVLVNSEPHDPSGHTIEDLKIIGPFQALNDVPKVLAKLLGRVKLMDSVNSFVYPLPAPQVTRTIEGT
jgi:hypothetical protein